MHPENRTAEIGTEKEQDMDRIVTMDWHIHSLASYDGTQSYQEIVRNTRDGGIREFGITEHIDLPFAIYHLKFSRKMFLDNYVEGMHFGVELSVYPRFQIEYIRSKKCDVYPLLYAGMLPEFVEGFGKEDPELVRRSREDPNLILADLTEEQIRENKVEYVNAGAHLICNGAFDRDSIIRHWHTQQMICATDDRVDVIAHPWTRPWSPQLHFEAERRGGLWPTENSWLDDFGVIPESMHDEFASALIRNDKAAELNMNFFLSEAYTDKFRHQYAEYFRGLFEKGVRITTGSDYHDNRTYDRIHELSEIYLRPLGFRAEDFSKPKLRKY